MKVEITHKTSSEQQAAALVEKAGDRNEIKITFNCSRLGLGP
jgi:hypothetical protein